MTDIVVRFPTPELAREFMAGMMDGFGENACDFSWWRQKPGTSGDKREHYEHAYTAEGEIPAGTQICFVTRMTHYDKEPEA